MATITSTPSNRILLKGVQWSTYQALIKDLESQPNQRLIYDGGLLEIMTPLPEHESYKKLLDRIVEVTTEEMNIEIRSLGSCTWQREDLKQGLEPDECYYITSELAVRNKKILT
jgi:Uma2 family endonuclease